VRVRGSTSNLQPADLFITELCMNTTIMENSSVTRFSHFLQTQKKHGLHAHLWIGSDISDNYVVALVWCRMILRKYATLSGNLFIRVLENICKEIMEFHRRSRYDLMYMKTKELG